MLMRRLAFILLILSALILYFFANETVTLALLLTLIVMPLASLGLLALSGRRLTVSMEEAPASVENPGSPVMRFRMENRDILPIALAEMEVVCENLRTGETDSFVISESPGPKRKKEIDFEVDSSRAGRYRIYVQAAKIYDPLMLACKTVSCDDSRCFTVMPSVTEIILSDASDAALLENDRAADRRGVDPGDIRGIREYVPGDPVRNIHWKLSEKTGKMLIKELGNPLTDQFLVVLGDQREVCRDAEALEAIAAVYASLIETLRIEKAGLTIAWTDPATGKAVFKKIYTEEDAAAAADEYLAAPASQSGAFAKIEWDISESRYAHVVIVGSKIPTGIDAIANGCNVAILLYGAEGSITENNVTVIGFDSKTYGADLAGAEI